MNKLIGAALLGQSGGPTSVINASAAGVFLEALKHQEITEVYGAAHGIKGILNEEFYDIKHEDIRELERLLHTPSSEIGSVRYKLKDPSVDDTDYKRLLEVFKKYNIRYFFYNGGNDSMDTCLKISKFFQKENYDCRVIGVPKTIDNDLAGTDHSPGYGSAAKYVATTLMELYLDACVYDIKQVTIVEVMGRNAGWLTAAAELAKHKGTPIDLIYLPEVTFDEKDFFDQVCTKLKDHKNVFVVISEGIKNKDGKYIPEMYQSLEKDAFGHTNLGGAALALAKEVKNHLGVKVRGIEFSLIQRCAAHLASKTDVTEAFNVGKIAVSSAIDGATDCFVAIKRISSNPYQVEYPLVPLTVVANAERKIPLEWILPHGAGLSKEYIEYALPLIQGENKQELEDGLPRFARLKKVLVSKKG